MMKEAEKASNAIKTLHLPLFPFFESRLFWWVVLLKQGQDVQKMQLLSIQENKRDKREKKSREKPQNLALWTFLPTFPGTNH